MGFITHYFTVYKRFCKPAVIILLIALGWAAVVWGLWPVKAWRPWREVCLLAVLSAWVWAWWRTSVTPPDAPKTRVMWAVAVLMGVCLVMPPFQSTDVYGYVNRGWQQVWYHTNPYVTTISQLPHWQADLRLTDHWIDNPCPYGVLFAHIARLVCGLGHLLQADKAGLTMLFKASQVAVLACTLWVINRIRRTLGSTADRLSLTALCWHPLLLIHGIANGHNDGWVGLSNVLAVSAAMASPVMAPLALLSGGLIKLMPLVALPMTILTLWRLSGFRVALAGSALCVGVAAALIAPYWHPAIQWTALLDNAGLSHNSLHALLTDLYQWSAPPGLLPSHLFFYGWLKGLLWLAYGLCWLWVSLLPVRLATWTWTRWLTALLGLQAGLLLLASTKFHGWYLNMLLPLLWLLPLRAWWVRALLGVSLANSFGVSFLGRAHIANVVLMTLLPIAWAWWTRPKTIGPLAAADE